MTIRVLRVIAKDSCLHCRRPIEKIENFGWLHGELPQYAHEENTCEYPEDLETWRERRKKMTETKLPWDNPEHDVLADIREAVLKCPTQYQGAAEEHPEFLIKLMEVVEND